MPRKMIEVITSRREDAFSKYGEAELACGHTAKFFWKNGEKPKAVCCKQCNGDKRKGKH